MAPSHSSSWRIFGSAHDLFLSARKKKFQFNFFFLFSLYFQKIWYIGQSIFSFLCSEYFLNARHRVSKKTYDGSLLGRYEKFCQLSFEQVWTCPHPKKSIAIRRRYWKFKKKLHLVYTSLNLIKYDAINTK